MTVPISVSSVSSPLDTQAGPDPGDMEPRPVYDLLPVIHRLRDAAVGGQLSALLAVVETELQRLRDDIDGLYDDWFIETCAEWVVPYLGDLLGVQGLRAVPGGVASQRSLVANTIRYRRRKGTPGVLEQVARDVTGWPARVVESFSVLSTTQHLDHVRLGAPGTGSLRDAHELARTTTPFGHLPRNGEVRHVDLGRGRFNLPWIALHLWRLAAYRLEGVDARLVESTRGGWTFDPAGRDVMLFHPGRTETPDVTHLAEEPDVPAPLTRRDLLADLAGERPAYLAEPTPAFRIRLIGETSSDLVDPSRVRCCDLTDWTVLPAIKAPGAQPAEVAAPPADSDPPVVAVDPALGRLAVLSGDRVSRVIVDYAYGAAGDLGAGPYDRREGLARALALMGLGSATTGAGPVDWMMRVSQSGDVIPGRRARSIGEALALWRSRPNLDQGQTGVIAVLDSSLYLEDLVVDVPLGDRLILVAAGLPGTMAGDPSGDAAGYLPGLDDVTLTARGLRPHIVGDITVAAGDGGGEFLVDGFSVEGEINVAPGDLAGLVVADSTVLASVAAAPDAGWITATGNKNLTVNLLRTVAAGVRLPEVAGLTLADSFLYAGGSNPDPVEVALDAASAAMHLESSTVLGRTAARGFTASNCILTGLVDVTQRQEGCVRFSYLPEKSRTPRRYHCQPPSGATSPVPVFTSVQPGDPGFGQLTADCAVAITTGAEDEGEMGAFHFLQQSRRMSNLASQLDQYLRFGLEAGVFFTT